MAVAMPVLHLLLDLTMRQAAMLPLRELRLDLLNLLFRDNLHQLLATLAQEQQQALTQEALLCLEQVFSKALKVL